LANEYPGQKNLPMHKSKGTRAKKRTSAGVKR
jgi:hypothetical protein